MLVVAVIILFVGLTVHAYDKESSSCRDAGNEFDIFVFAELSPGADCYMTKNCSVSAGTPNLTIHGLWPSNTKAYKYNCEVPCYCNSSYKFNMTEIKELTNSLDTLWPAVMESKEFDWNCKHSSSENEYLWCHEWGKHGTCATAGLQEIHNEFDFFSKVLRLFNNHLNYDKFVLAKHGVTPSHSKPYPLDSFAEAFYKEWMVHPVLICNRAEENGYQRQVLQSIRICLDKIDFSPIECPDCVLEKGNCDSEELIYYYPA